MTFLMQFFIAFGMGWGFGTTVGLSFHPDYAWYIKVGPIVTGLGFICMIAFIFMGNIHP
jgi:hypothetical protein